MAKRETAGDRQSFEGEGERQREIARASQEKMAKRDGEETGRGREDESKGERASLFHWATCLIYNWPKLFFSKW